MGRPRTPPAQRFWSKVRKTEACWLWTAAVQDGYGVFAAGFGIKTKAHVWAWTQENGSVPAGLELDHLCRVRNCVRPSHLEPVTKAENKRRSMDFVVPQRDAAGRFV